MFAFWLSIKPTVPIYGHQQQVTTSVGVSRDNVVYAASSDQFLYALHDNDGSVIWKFQTGAAIVASPSLFPEHMMSVG